MSFLGVGKYKHIVVEKLSHLLYANVYIQDCHAFCYKFRST